MPILSDKSLIFQRTNVDLGDVEPQVNGTLQNLQRRPTRLGQWENKIEQHKFEIRRLIAQERNSKKP